MTAPTNGDSRIHRHRGLAIGICIGTALGVAMGKLAIGVAIGVALGVGLDAANGSIRSRKNNSRADAVK